MPSPAPFVAIILAAALLAAAPAAAETPAAAPGTATDCMDRAPVTTEGAVTPTAPAQGGETGSTATADGPAAKTLDGSESSKAWAESQGSTAMLDCVETGTGQ